MAILIDVESTSAFAIRLGIVPGQRFLEIILPPPATFAAAAP